MSDYEILVFDNVGSVVVIIVIMWNRLTVYLSGWSLQATTI